MSVRETEESFNRTTRRFRSPNFGPPPITGVDDPPARHSAVAFIHRFGPTLNPHLHFHCVVIDSVFDAAAADGVVVHAASGSEANAIAAVQAQVRRRLLPVVVQRGLLPDDAAREIAQWVRGGGFCVDGRFRANWLARP